MTERMESGEPGKSNKSEKGATGSSLILETYRRILEVEGVLKGVKGTDIDTAAVARYQDGLKDIEPRLLIETLNTATTTDLQQKRAFYAAVAKEVRSRMGL